MAVVVGAVVVVVMSGEGGGSVINGGSATREKRKTSQESNTALWIETHARGITQRTGSWAQCRYQTSHSVHSCFVPSLRCRPRVTPVLIPSQSKPFRAAGRTDTC
jgi:hypothetical protein